MATDLYGSTSAILGLPRQTSPDTSKGTPGELIYEVCLLHTPFGPTSTEVGPKETPRRSRTQGLPSLSELAAYTGYMPGNSFEAEPFCFYVPWVLLPGQLGELNGLIRIERLDEQKATINMPESSEALPLDDSEGRRCVAEHQGSKHLMKILYNRLEAQHLRARLHDVVEFRLRRRQCYERLGLAP